MLKRVVKISGLIFDESPLVISTTLAKVVGLNSSIIIQQMHYWLIKSDKVFNDKKWVYNTYAQWQEQFPFWSLSTIRRTIADLENSGVIITGNFNKMKADKTKWYTLNYEKIEGMSSPCVQNEQSMCSNWTAPCVQNEQSNTIDYTENTTEITTTGSDEGMDSEQSVHEKIADVQKVFETYQNSIHPIAGQIEVDMLTDLINSYSANWVYLAIKEALRNNVRNMKYIESILRRWHTSGMSEPWNQKKEQVVSSKGTGRLDGLVSGGKRFLDRHKGGGGNGNTGNDNVNGYIGNS